MTGIVVLTAIVLATAGSDIPRFEDVTEAVGINSLRPVLGMPPATGGAAWFDWDEDGYVDVLLTCEWEPLKLYRNTGPPNWHFEDVTNAAGLGEVRNAISADLMRVGGQTTLALMLVEEFGNRLQLFQISAPGKAFFAIPIGWPGGLGFFMTHGDIDGDGDIDVVASMNTQCGPSPKEKRTVWLLENDWGLFRPRRDDVWPAPGCAAIPMVTDYEGTGRLVTLITNDFGTYLTPTLAVGLDGIDRTLPPVYGMGIAVGDLNGDLRSDYLFTSAKDDALWTSDGSQWQYQTSEYGMGTGWGEDGLRFKWGASFLDTDNDGTLELYVAAGWLGAADDLTNGTLQKNSLIQNGLDVASEAGVATETTDRTVSVVDYDQDGRLDLLVGALESWSLFRNVTETTHHWIEFVVPNKPGVSALVTCGDQTWHREWTAASEGAFSEPLIHVGLGDCQGPASATIRWPWAGAVTMTDLAVDQRHAVEYVPAVVVSPDTVQPGETYTVTVVADEDQDVVLDGLPMEWAGTAWTATRTAGPDSGESRVVAWVDGQPLGLQPRIRVWSQPEPALLMDPSPPRIGQSATLHLDVPAQGSVTVSLDGGVALTGLKSGPLGHEMQIQVTDDVLVVQALVDGAEYGEPLVVEAIPRVDASRSEVFMVANEDQVTVDVFPYDALDIPVFLDPSDVVLVKDGESQADLFELQGMAKYVTQTSGSGLAQVPAGDVLLAQSIPLDTLGSGPFDADQSRIFPIFDTLQADGQDITAVLVYFADAQGQPLARPEDLSIEVDGLEVLGDVEPHWESFYISIGTFEGIRLRADTTPGLATVSIGGMTTTVRKVAPVHNTPVLETTTLAIDPKEGVVVLRPRDKNGHLVGSGVSLSFESDPPVDGSFAYEEFGRYVLSASVDSITVTVDGLFQIAEPPLPSTPAPTCSSGGCAMTNTPTRAWWGLTGLFLVVLLGWRSTGNIRWSP